MQSSVQQTALFTMQATTNRSREILHLANQHASCTRIPRYRELLTGIKTSFTGDLRIGFLDYAQLTEPVSETTYNTLKPRTRGGVAFYSLGTASFL